MLFPFSGFFAPRFAFHASSFPLFQLRVVGRNLIPKEPTTAEFYLSLKAYTYVGKAQRRIEEWLSSTNGFPFAANSYRKLVDDSALEKNEISISMKITPMLTVVRIRFQAGIQRNATGLLPRIFRRTWKEYANTWYYVNFFVFFSIGVV